MVRYWCAERRNVRFIGRGSSSSGSSFSRFILECRPHPSPPPIPVATQTARTQALGAEISPQKTNSNTHLCGVTSRLSLFILRLFSKGKKKKSERPLKGQCEWQGLWSISIMFYRKEVRINTLKLISMDVSGGSLGAL